MCSRATSMSGYDFAMCKDVTNKHCEDGRNRRDERSNQGRHGGQLQ
jgi:hypothetical protein